jgi:hypothetical protein
MVLVEILALDKVVLMEVFSCLIAVASVSVVDIISRSRITSCSRCLM